MLQEQGREGGSTLSCTACSQAIFAEARLTSVQASVTADNIIPKESFPHFKCPFLNISSKDQREQNLYTIYVPRFHSQQYLASQSHFMIPLSGI